MQPAAELLRDQGQGGLQQRPWYIRMYPYPLRQAGGMDVERSAPCVDPRYVSSECAEMLPVVFGSSGCFRFFS